MSRCRPSDLRKSDPEIYSIIKRELRRQQNMMQLIASENYTPLSVLEAAGSVLTNKYAEGYPGKRWYQGCKIVSEAEQAAIDRGKELFGAEHANVQPHSGTQANMAVYFAALKPGDRLLSMTLSEGGHLSHGFGGSFSGRDYSVAYYLLSRETELIDYEGLGEVARANKPKMIIAGGSSYPREIDFERFAAVAEEVGALLLVDMAHFAGLVAAGVHPDPVPHADFVSGTTHKTLRGPRGGFVLCKEEYAGALDDAVFPGLQGGPLMHVVAAKAVCFKLAQTEEFRAYQRQVVENARALGKALEDKGYRLVTGGTDTHIVLVDLQSLDMTGQAAARVLNRAGIAANKNPIPFDPRPPAEAGGIRLGTPAITTRGMKAKDMERVAELIDRALRSESERSAVRRVREDVAEFLEAFPVYEELSQEWA